MANNTNRQAYNAEIELAFDYNGERTPIKQEKIIYIMIERDYVNQIIPVIYVSLTVNNDLYTKILKYKKSAKFYLNIKKTNKFFKGSLQKQSLCGTFSYIPSNTNPNYQEDLSDPNAIPDAAYKKLMIGLVSIELTNTIRQTYNGIYNNIDQKTLISTVLEGTKCVVENLTYNKLYDSIIIPPITSRYQMIKYIFDKDNFYDTNFRYFVDFDRAYLTSKRGEPVDAEDGDLNTVMVDIRSVTEQEAYLDGIAVKNNAYYVYINPSQSNVSLNEGVEKVANQIVSVDEDANNQTLNLDINNTEGSATKQMFIRTSNAALYKNELETNSVTIEIVKQHIDGSVFTPNKCILVSNYGQYARYDGKYIMTYKKEFYRSVGGEFVMSCVIGLRKVGNILPAGSIETTNRKYSKGSATKKSTASQYNRNKARKATR